MHSTTARVSTTAHDGNVKELDPLANCISILDQDHCYHPSFPPAGHNPHQNLVTARMHNGSITSRGDRMPLKGPNGALRELDDGFQQLNQYKLYDKIGQGSYGLVKLAYSEADSTHYAMKILSKRRLKRQAGLMKRGPKQSTGSPLDRVYREIAILKKLDHPNVVKLVEVLDDPMDDSLYMVFEFVSKGEILQLPTQNPLSEASAWSAFRDTLMGLEYLHHQHIIHADLKPENLLLTESGRVKIADLGVCIEFMGKEAILTNERTVGTPAFRAPETISTVQKSYCGKSADIWSLGITLYALVYGNVPFMAKSIPGLYEKILNDPVQFPLVPVISIDLQDCILRMLCKDPMKRITLPQLKENKWVTRGGCNLLPTETENCGQVEICENDMKLVVRSIPKLDTLILIKTMLKKHSFGNPFLQSVTTRERFGSRICCLTRADRSLSAPESSTIVSSHKR